MNSITPHHFVSDDVMFLVYCIVPVVAVALIFWAWL